MGEADRTVRAGLPRLSRALALLVLLILLMVLAPTVPRESRGRVEFPLVLSSAQAFPGDGIRLDAQAASAHFAVKAQHQDVADATLRKAERAWAILKPHFPAMVPRLISIAVIEDQRTYNQIQPAPMTRGFSTFGGTQIVLAGRQLDQEVVTHELAHILLGLNINPRLSLPDWFNEGFAQYASGARPDALEMMYYVSGNQFVSLPQLDKVDALHSPNRQLATLQGLAVVQFLVDSYGQDRFWRLIGALGTARSLNQAMLDTYGLTDLQLDRQWTLYADRNYSLFSPAMLRLVGLVVVGALAMVAAGAVLVRRRRPTAAEGPDLTWSEIEAARLAEEEAREGVVDVPPPSRSDQF